MNILLTNDDGINAEGIVFLREVLSEIANVYVIAPHIQRSGYSHLITVNKPVKTTELEKDLLMIEGTPADCVKLGLEYIYKDMIDIVVSGINDGPNIGEDIYYSGTLAAARESIINKIPSIAFSIDGHGEIKNFPGIKKYIINIVKHVFKEGIPEGTLLNVNFPNPTNGNTIKGIKYTIMGRRLYKDSIVERSVPQTNGKVYSYYWIGWEKPKELEVEDSDIQTISSGYVSVTPIGLDTTNYKFLDKLKKWTLD